MNVLFREIPKQVRLGRALTFLVVPRMPGGIRSAIPETGLLELAHDSDFICRANIRSRRHKPPGRELGENNKACGENAWFSSVGRLPPDVIFARLFAFISLSRSSCKMRYPTRGSPVMPYYEEDDLNRFSEIGKHRPDLFDK